MDLHQLSSPQKSIRKLFVSGTSHPQPGQAPGPAIHCTSLAPVPVRKPAASSVPRMADAAGGWRSLGYQPNAMTAALISGVAGGCAQAGRWSWWMRCGEVRRCGDFSDGVSDRRVRGVIPAGMNFYRMIYDLIGDSMLSIDLKGGFTYRRWQRRITHEIQPRSGRLHCSKELDCKSSRGFQCPCPGDAFLTKPGHATCGTRWNDTFAQVMYIVPLMWLRTIMEYQYKPLGRGA